MLLESYLETKKKKEALMEENGQKCSISMISHINLGGAGQQPAKHGQQGGTRDLFGPSE